MRVATLAQAESALASSVPLPPGIRGVLEGARKEAVQKEGVSPWAYGYLDPASTGRPLFLIDACGGPATLVFPRGTAFDPGADFNPVMMLSRDRHAQLVVRDGPAPDFAALIAAGKVILIDGLVDGVGSASQLAPNSDAPTSEVSPAFAFVIDSVAQHLNGLPTDHDDCYWLTVHGSAIPKSNSPSSESAAPATKRFLHSQSLAADVDAYFSVLKEQDTLASNLTSGLARILGRATPAHRSWSTWTPTKEGTSYALVDKKIRSQLEGDKKARKLVMAYHDAWRKARGSLEFMARDVHHLTPGCVSHEVDPARLNAVIKHQLSFGLRDEVMEQLTTGTQWTMTWGSEKVRQRGSV